MSMFPQSQTESAYCPESNKLIAVHQTSANLKLGLVFSI